MKCNENKIDFLFFLLSIKERFVHNVYEKNVGARYRPDKFYNISHLSNETYLSSRQSVICTYRTIF